MKEGLDHDVRLQSGGHVPRLDFSCQDVFHFRETCMLTLTECYVAISVRSVYFLCKYAKAPTPDTMHIMATRHQQLEW
jgi:hypothetical protein